MKDRDSSAHSKGHGIVSISGSCPKSTAATYCAFRMPTPNANDHNLKRFIFKVIFPYRTSMVMRVDKTERK